MNIHSHEDLLVWQKSMTLAAGVYSMARSWELRDRLALGVQIQRSAVSLPSNVAEGWSRGPGRVLTFHLRVALGSNAELQTQLALAARVGILDAPSGAALDSQTKEVGRMLRGLLKSTQRHQ